MTTGAGVAQHRVDPDDTTRHGARGCETIREVVRADVCIGCGGCAVASHGAYGITFERSGLYQAVVNPEQHSEVDERRIATVCPFSNTAENENEIAARVFPDATYVHSAAGRWHAAYVGWVNESDFRTSGSSGGMVSWLLAELLRRGEIDGVVHVIAHTPTDQDPRLFKYRLSRTIGEIKQGAKSRYYPIEFSSALEEVRTHPGRYAFVGVPCFVKAIRLLMRNDELIRSRIKVCLGLFCGHLKSSALVESFARQSGLEPSTVTAVDFRLKQPERRADVYTMGLATKDGSTRAQDWRQMVDGDWGMGFFQYSACNYCDDVMAETADVSFGDAWVQPYSSDGRGTNVTVVRAAWLDEIFRSASSEGRLELSPVDGDFLAKTQAAGLRQRREGLAYRLAKRGNRATPGKRVAPDPSGGGWKRRRIYDLRRLITYGSHRVFGVSRRWHAYWIYRFWARCMGKAYRTIYWIDRGSLKKRLVSVLRPRLGARG
jgi:coenzyme F420-reducing hydrogenase beta subunit